MEERSDYAVDATEMYDQYLDQSVSEEVIKESTSFPTLRAGSYQGTIESKELRTASDQSPWPGRFMVHLGANVTSVDENGRGGRIWFDVSPLVTRTENGRLDGPSSLWGQLVKALDLVGAPNRDVIANIDLYPYRFYVTEAFKTDVGYRTPTSDEERTQYVTEGFLAKNFVRNLKKAG